MWQAASWGATVAEVMKAFGGATRVDGDGAARGGEALAPGAALESVWVAGHLWSARFLFDGAGRLGAIELQAAGAFEADDRAYDDVAASLAADYGRPRAGTLRSSPSGGGGSRATWSTADGLIELQGEDLEARRARVVAVDLRAGRVRPIPARGVVITVRPPSVPEP
jgi:hypothetical protein